MIQAFLQETPKKHTHITNQGLISVIEKSYSPFVHGRELFNICWISSDPKTFSSFTCFRQKAAKCFNNHSQRIKAKTYCSVEDSREESLPAGSCAPS